MKFFFSLRTPDPGNHSFAGISTTFSSSKTPRSQTEVINFRDRTLGLTDAAGGGKRRGYRMVRDTEHREHEAAGPGPVLSANRSPEETASLREQLCQVFPGQDNMVMLVLQCHPALTDINVLSDLILEKQDE